MESGSGSNGAWVTGVGMKGEVDDVGVDAPITLLSGHIFCGEESPENPDCVNWSGVNKDEVVDRKGLTFKPIKEDRGYGTDLTGSTGVGLDTAFPANSAWFAFKSWWDEEIFIFSSLLWDGRNPFVGKDDEISREEESCTEGSEGEKFGSTKVEVEVDDTGVKHSDASVKPTVIGAWIPRACTSCCAFKSCDIADGWTVIWFCGEWEMPIDVPLYNIGNERDGELAVWVAGETSNAPPWPIDWFKDNKLPLLNKAGVSNHLDDSVKPANDDVELTGVPA